MTSISSPLTEDAQKIVGSALQDLFIQITAALEKQYWMFQAEQA